MMTKMKYCIFVIPVLVVIGSYGMEHMEWCSYLPKAPPNAQVRRFDFNPYIAEVYCSEGYQLIGDGKLKCMNSTWKPAKLPHCDKIETDDPPVANAGENVVVLLPQTSVVLNGNKSYDDHGIVNYYWLDILDYSPVHIEGERTPYLKVSNLKKGIFRFTLRVVDKKGQASEDTVQVTVLNHVDECGDPPKINHGTAVRTLYNQVTYKCDDGYHKDNEISILICEGQRWLGNTPICRPQEPLVIKSCTKPHQIPHGTWKATNYFIYNLGYQENVFEPGTQVTYSCDSSDYELLGNPVIECQQDMKWSRQHPVCIKKSDLIDKDFYCPSVPPIPNGQCQCDLNKNISFCEPFYLTMSVLCSCNKGYWLRGSDQMTCSGKGTWNTDQPTCIPVMSSEVHTEVENHQSVRMNTLAVVIATACSVLGVLLLIMVVMVIRRRKPRPRQYHQIPPPYQRVHDELDRVALIGYDAARLPTYEEAVRTNSPSASAIPVATEFRPLPSISNVVRNAQNSDIQSINSRHSITSTVNPEVFGSIDTVNYSMSDASTSVTVDTLDSTTSRPSNCSGRTTAGSMSESQENIVITDDAPLLMREFSVEEEEDKEDKDEDKE